MRLRILPRSRKAWLRCLLIWAFVMLVGFIMLRRFVGMPGKSFSGPLPALSEEQLSVRDGMELHVHELAGRLGERNAERPEALDAAADYIAAEWRDCGYEPAEQTYDVRDRAGTLVRARNIEIDIPGSRRPGEIVVVGAHYDSVIGSPGANDNASGVAALLELGRLLHGRRFARTLRFVAFTNEEPPFFWTEMMGSRVYARRCAERNENIIGAVILETIGCYSDEPGSQSYPFPLGLVYPNRGDFIAFVGNTKSRALVRRAIGRFRRTAEFPSEGLAAPMIVPRVGSSDHWSFWKEGWPAIMVTDTAPLRYRHYHRGSDTPDKVDCDRAARVAVGIGWVVADLAGMAREE